MSLNINSPPGGAVSKVGFMSHRVILNLFQDLCINGLRFRNESGMTLSRTSDTALAGVSKYKDATSAC